MNSLKNRFLAYALVLLSSVMMVWGCSDDDDDLPFYGTDTHFLSLSLTSAEGKVYEAAITDSTLVLYVPSNVSLEGAKVAYKICEQASILPDPATITDWDSEQVFRLIAYNGTVEHYTLKIVRENVYSEGSVTLNTQAEVVAFAELGINIVDGNLIIGSMSIEDDPVITLSPLKGLTCVKGAIIIRDTYTGNSLSGLENLREVGAIMIGTQESRSDIATKINIDMPKLEKAGDLIMNSNCVQTLSLPMLKRISKLYMDSKSLEEIALPQLEVCTGDIELGTNANRNDNLVRLLCPKLQRVGGKFVVQYMSELKQIDLSSLSEVVGNLSFSNLTVVEALEAEELVRAGGIEIVNTYTPARIVFPKLAVVNTFNIFATANNYEAEILDFSALTEVKGAFTLSAKAVNLPVISFPKLTTIGGAAKISALTASSDIQFPKLTKVNNLTFDQLLEIKELLLPQLTSMGDLSVSSMSELITLSFPKLTSSGSISLSASAKLTNVSVPLLMDCKGISLRGLDGMEEFQFPEAFATSFSGSVTIYDCKKLAQVLGPNEYKGAVALTLVNGEGTIVPKFVATGGTLVHMKGGFQVSSNGRTGDLEIVGIQSVGGALSVSCSSTWGKPKVPFRVSFPDLEKLETLSMSNYDGMIESFEAPKLALVTGNLSFYQMNAVKAFNFPLLTEIQGNFTLGGATYQKLPLLKNLDGFCALTTLGGTLNITYCTALTDYSGLKNLFSNLDLTKCTIQNNAYNPTLEDIEAGRLVQE